jgi:predicted DNA-binding transcriptional regulator
MTTKRETVWKYIDGYRDRNNGTYPTGTQIAIGTGISAKTANFYLYMMKPKPPIYDVGKPTAATRVYIAIYRWWVDNDLPPTLDDIAGVLGVSQTAVAKQVKALCAKGFIYREHNKHRSIRVPAYEKRKQRLEKVERKRRNAARS